MHQTIEILWISCHQCKVWLLVAYDTSSGQIEHYLMMFGIMLLLQVGFNSKIVFRWCSTSISDNDIMQHIQMHLVLVDSLIKRDQRHVNGLYF